MATMLHAGILSLLLVAGADDAPAKYARPELLIEPTALAGSQARKKFVILDARPAADYKKGHVPGAVRVDADAWSKAFARDEGRAAWVKRIGAVGIDTSTPVVVYATRLPEAARVWWVLRYWGVDDVRLLNGGWAGWQRVKGPTSTTAATVQETTPNLKAQDDRLATKGQLLDWLKEDRAIQVIDTRSAGEHCGETVKAKRSGAIPKARHLEWSDTVEAKTGRFRSPAELAKLFKDANIDPAKPATTYCQSGGRAAVMAFVLELASGKPARNYYRSWSEWGNDDTTPIVRPKKK
jgi:thiosulfate/3-mercaptopyruvate sulfurtransferase